MWTDREEKSRKLRDSRDQSVTGCLFMRSDEADRNINEEKELLSHGIQPYSMAISNLKSPI